VGGYVLVRYNIFSVSAFNQVKESRTEIICEEVAMEVKVVRNV